MYCAKCDEILEDAGIVDEHGYHWSYDVQLCKICRPKKIMTDAELRIFLNISEDEWAIDNFPMDSK